MRGQETDVIEMEEDVDGVFKEKRRVKEKRIRIKSLGRPQKFEDQTDELFYNLGVGINIISNISKTLKKF